MGRQLLFVYWYMLNLFCLLCTICKCYWPFQVGLSLTQMKRLLQEVEVDLGVSALTPFLLMIQMLMQAHPSLHTLHRWVLLSLLLEGMVIFSFALHFFFLFFYNYVIFLQAQAFVQVCDSLHPFSFQVSFGHGENRNRKFGRQTSAMACSDHKVFVVWLESFDDCYTFPASKWILSYSWQKLKHLIFDGK